MHLRRCGAARDALTLATVTRRPGSTLGDALHWRTTGGRGCCCAFRRDCSRCRGDGVVRWSASVRLPQWPPRPAGPRIWLRSAGRQVEARWCSSEARATLLTPCSLVLAPPVQKPLESPCFPAAQGYTRSFFFCGPYGPHLNLPRAPGGGPASPRFPSRCDARAPGGQQHTGRLIAHAPSPLCHGALYCPLPSSPFSLRYALASAFPRPRPCWRGDPPSHRAI